MNSAGQVVEVDPIEVIFNDAMPLMAAHMVIAAYVVGGFLVASVYAVAMLRGRRDHYHRLAFIIAFSVASKEFKDLTGGGHSGKETAIDSLGQCHSFHSRLDSSA